MWQWPCQICCPDSDYCVEGFLQIIFSKLSNKRNLDEIEREKKRQNAVINRQIKKDKNKLRKQVKISIG